MLGKIRRLELTLSKAGSTCTIMLVCCIGGPFQLLDFSDSQSYQHAYEEVAEQFLQNISLVNVRNASLPHGWRQNQFINNNKFQLFLPLLIFSRDSYPPRLKFQNLQDCNLSETNSSLLQKNQLERQSLFLWKGMFSRAIDVAEVLWDIHESSIACLDISCFRYGDPNHHDVVVKFQRHFGLHRAQNNPTISQLHVQVL